jgi:hypothetical protein
VASVEFRTFDVARREIGSRHRVER